MLTLLIRMMFVHGQTPQALLHLVIVSISKDKKKLNQTATSIEEFPGFKSGNSTTLCS